MANVMTKGGKVLTKDGKVATDPRCCCCLGKWGREFVVTISGPVPCVCFNHSYATDVVIPPAWPVVYQPEWNHFFTGPTWVSEYAGSGKFWSGLDCDSAALYSEESWRIEAQCVGPGDDRMHAVLFSVGSDIAGHGPLIAFEAIFDAPGDVQPNMRVCALPGMPEGTGLFFGGFGSV